MDGDDWTIGGDTSTGRELAVFAVGAAIGTAMRIGMWLLPAGLVDRMKGYL